MSTCYVFDGKVTESDLRAAMVMCGVEEEVTKDTTPTYLCLTREGSYLWASLVDGLVGNVTRYGRNDDDLLYDIGEVLGMSVVCEHDEDWDEVLDSMENDSGLVTINLEDLIASGDAVLIRPKNNLH